MALPLVLVASIAAWPFPAHACEEKGETPEDERLAANACYFSTRQFPNYARGVLGAQSSRARLLLTIDPQLAARLDRDQRTLKRWFETLLSLKKGPRQVVICIENNLQRSPFMVAQGWPVRMYEAEQEDCR
jgi:hypothetical protein